MRVFYFTGIMAYNVRCAFVLRYDSRHLLVDISLGCPEVRGVSPVLPTSYSNGDLTHHEVNKVQRRHVWVGRRAEGHLRSRM